MIRFSLFSILLFCRYCSAWRTLLPFMFWKTVQLKTRFEKKTFLVYFKLFCTTRSSKNKDCSFQISKEKSISYIIWRDRKGWKHVSGKRTGIVTVGFRKKDWFFKMLKTRTWNISFLLQTLLRKSYFHKKPILRCTAY